MTGFAGPWLARHLIDAGESVAGLAVTEPGEPLPAGVELHLADIRDPDRLRELVAGIAPRRVYHLAALSHVGRSWERREETLDVNVVGTGLLLEAVEREAPEARVLLVSTGQVYGPAPSDRMPLDEEQPSRPISPYAASKVCCEVLARQAADAGSLTVTIARPFNFAGPGQHPSFVCSDFARQVARIETGDRQPVVRVGNLDARRDFTDVRDMVAGFDAVVRRGAPGRAYNLASGRAVSIQSILDRLLAMAGTSIEVERDPDRMRPSDVPIFVGDPTRARDELEWRADRPLEQTLADTLDFWREKMDRAGSDA